MAVSKRPRAYTTGNDVVIPDSMLDESFRGEYDGSNNLIYKGFARPGSSESQEVWQIAKLAYDAGNNVISIKWPALEDFYGTVSSQASNDYRFSWTDRATYTYL